MEEVKTNLKEVATLCLEELTDEEIAIYSISYVGAQQIEVAV